MKKNKKNTAKVNLREGLLAHPLGSKEHKKMVELLEKDCKRKPDHDKFVLCIKNKFAKTNILEPQNLSGKQEGLIEFDQRLFPKNSTFMESDSFTKIRRWKAEPDLTLKQLIVGCYITDGERIILLDCFKDKNQRRMTLIQGHVEYSQDCYMKSIWDILKLNMEKELEEELVIPNLIKDQIKLDEPKYMLNTYTESNDVRHLGIIYEIRVKNVLDLSALLKSGEPDKHSIRVIDLNGNMDLINPGLSLWTELIINKLRPETRTIYPL